MKKLISELQVGDTVLRNNAWGLSLEKVENITSSFVVVNGSKYKKVDDYEVDAYHQYDYTSIRIISEEEIEEFQRKEEIKKKRRFLAQCHFNGLEPEVIE